jgi:hypothetical protein
MEKAFGKWYRLIPTIPETADDEGRRQGLRNTCALLTTCAISTTM